MSRYIYECATCGGSVTKPQVFTPDPSGTGQKVSKKLERVGLHGWRCSSCGPVKVKRSLAKELKEKNG